MSRTLRTFAVLALGLALVAALPAPCSCEAQHALGGGEHGCCAPSTGVRAADHGCCGALGVLVDQAGAPPVPGALAPAPTPGIPGTAALLSCPVPPDALAFSPSPPPTILRI